MSGKHGKLSLLLALPLLLLSVTAARAEQTARYLVGGQLGAVVWGIGEDWDSEVLALAFSRATPLEPEPKEEAAASVAAPLPPPGPRLVFSVTRWTLEGGEWVQRQWFGDAALDPLSLVIAAGVTGGTLDATVPGFLEETRESGDVTRREVEGRIQVSWTAMGRTANTTIAYSYQTPSYGLMLQTAGAGRATKATATLTVAGLGAPIKVNGIGNLSAVTTGLLQVTQQ
jgi:hypothetical protein